MQPVALQRFVYLFCCQEGLSSLACITAVEAKHTNALGSGFGYPCSACSDYDQA